MAASNIQVNLSNSAGNVDILVEGKRGIEHNFDKQLIILSQPNQSPPLVLINDLQRLKEVSTVNGFLEDTTATSALAKKNTLRTILQTAAKCTLAWGASGVNTRQTYNGNVLKGSIKEISGKLGDEGTQGKIFSVMLQFGVGTHRG